MTNIFLYEDENMVRANIKNFVKKWNDLRPDEPFDLIEHTNEEMQPNSAILFFNVSLNEEIFALAERYLYTKPDLSICFFLEQKERPLIPHINQLQQDYPFSNIGTILKPTQYSRVNQFLESVLNRKDMIVIDDNWNVIDIDFD